MPLVVLAVLGVAVYVVATRLAEIFCVSVRNGRVLVVRGAVPTPLLQDLADLMQRAGIERATLRAIKTSGHARLSMSGVDESTAQRCRNVFGTHPIHQLRSRPIPQGTKNLGQMLGIVWLAWLLAPRG